MEALREILQNIGRATQARIDADAKRGKIAIGEDGLAYCRICGEPVQRYIQWLDMPKKAVPVACKCIREEEWEWREKQREEDREKRRAICFGGAGLARLEGARFEADAGGQFRTVADSAINAEQQRKGLSYACHFPEMLEAGQGLLLCGGVGTGKSHLAAQIANAIIDGGYRVYFATVGRIQAETASGYLDDRAEYIRSLNAYDLLVLDDLGAERGTEYMQELMFSVVDGRYSTGKPLIVTTNASIQDMKTPKTQMQERIYDRVLQMCFPIRFDGASLRREDTRARYYRTQDILQKG